MIKIIPLIVLISFMAFSCNQSSYDQSNGYAQQYEEYEKQLKKAEEQSLRADKQYDKVEELNIRY